MLATSFQKKYQTRKRGALSLSALASRVPIHRSQGNRESTQKSALEQAVAELEKKNSQQAP